MMFFIANTRVLVACAIAVTTHPACAVGGASSVDKSSLSLYTFVWSRTYTFKAELVLYKNPALQYPVHPITQFLLVEP